MLRALYRDAIDKIKGENIKKEESILAKILNDSEIYHIIFDMLKQDHIGKVASFLHYLTRIFGKEKGKEFWSQYKESLATSQERQKEKLKAKINEALPREVVYLLKSLIKVDVGERNWILNEVIDDNILSPKIEEATLSTIMGLLYLLPDEKASAIISKLDPDSIAPKARTSSLLHINFFLRRCLQDPSNIEFASSFLAAIKEELIEKLKNSDLSKIEKYLKIVKKIDPNLHKNIIHSLKPYWLKIWLSSGLGIIARDLWRYRGSMGKQREFALLVVGNLASLDFSEPIKRLYDIPEAKPVKDLSKLLNCIYQIAFENDKEAVEKIAEKIVSNINLIYKERYTIQELSYLVANVRKCNETAWRQLCGKILSELELTKYIKIPFDKGLAALVWEIYQYSNEKGKELADEIFKLNFKELLTNSETEAVNRLIWDSLQINDSELRNWIDNISEEEWLSKALSSSTNEMFWLLWSLYQADEEKAKGVANLLANNLLSPQKTMEVMDLPLLGLLAFCGHRFTWDPPLPSLYEIAEKISEYIKLDELAFCIYFLRKKEELLKEFSREFQMLLFLRNQKFPIEEMLDEHPFEDAKKLFREIFSGFVLQKEPDSTFSEMIHLTQAFLKGRKGVSFSQLRDYFLNNPTGNPLFKSVDISTQWLNIAIKNGIYREKQVPHKRNPSRKVNLLSLNMNNQFVTLCLNEKRSEQGIVE